MAIFSSGDAIPSLVGPINPGQSAFNGRAIVAATNKVVRDKYMLNAISLFVDPTPARNHWVCVSRGAVQGWVFIDLIVFDVILFLYVPFPSE